MTVSIPPKYRYFYDNYLNRTIACTYVNFMLDNPEKMRIIHMTEGRYLRQIFIFESIKYEHRTFNSIGRELKIGGGSIRGLFDRFIRNCYRFYYTTPILYADEFTLKNIREYCLSLKNAHDYFLIKARNQLIDELTEVP